MAQKKPIKPTTKTSPQKHTHPHPYIIISLIAGIVGLLFSWTLVVWPVVALAIVFGFLGLHENKKTKSDNGHGMAITGISLGFAGLLVLIVMTIFLLVSLGTILTTLMSEIVDEVASANIDIQDDDVSMQIDYTNPDAQDIVVRDGIITKTQIT